MTPPRGITPLLRWLLVEVEQRPRAELLDYLEEVLARLESLDERVPRVAGLEEIAARFLQAGEAYREAVLVLFDQLERGASDGLAHAARCVRHGAALLEQADALNHRIPRRGLGWVA